MMNTWFRKLLFPGFLVLSCGISMAQVKTEHAENIAGKLTKHEQVYKFIRSFKVMPDAKASSLAKTSGKILDIICQSPLLNPPMGFDAEADVSADGLELKNKKPSLDAFCYLRYLIKDLHTGKIKKSLDGTDLRLEINAMNSFFDKIGNFWRECHELNFPLFFEELPMTDSTADYIEINFKHYGFPYISNNVKNSPIRIVRANNKPLLIPLTRKEYIQFLIAKENDEIQDAQGTIADIKKNIKQARETLAHPPSYLNDPVKKALTDAISTYEKQIIRFQEEIKNNKVKSGQYHNLLSTMSPQDAATPARINYDKHSDEFGGIDQLVPAGQKDGVMLIKINPDYYNNSAGVPVAQLITVYYSWSTIGFTQDPDYLQRATVNIFNHLDYHALKESMQ